MLRNFLSKLIRVLLFPRPAVGGRGVFDSIGGTYDEQTSFGFDQTLYTEARDRSLVGKFSHSGRNDIDHFIAGGPTKSLDSSAIIVKKTIRSGDMVRFTMQEHMSGNPTWGDNAVRRGDFLAYKNLEARINVIKSPAVPLQGEMALQRAKESIRNPKGALRKEVVDYMAQEMDYEFLLTLGFGASKSAMQSIANGGLAVNLGVGSNGVAGTPLMPKNFYSKDAGFMAYNDTPATHNATVNGHMNTCTAGADAITLLIIKTIRRQLDRLRFEAYLDGEKYKAICVMDPDLWYHLDHLLHDDYELAKPRKTDHEIFGVDHQLVYQGILFLNVPNLEIFRPAYDNAQGYPDMGPNMSSDPRSYTTASSIAWAFFLGSGAVFEGNNGGIRITEEEGYHTDGYEIGARMKHAFIRGEWYAKDGRAAAAANCYCNSVLAAIFYETGVGTLT